MTGAVILRHRSIQDTATYKTRETQKQVPRCEALPSYGGQAGPEERPDSKMRR
jgi:hypothetical protein